MKKIPSVDLNDFLSEDEALKQKFVSEIGDAYESIGFVALKGHFLKDALVTALIQKLKLFAIFRSLKSDSTKFQALGGSVAMYLLERKVPKGGRKEI